MHNELNSTVRKFKILQTRFEKLLVYFIKGFLKAELESNIAFFLFGSSHVMEDIAIRGPDAIRELKSLNLVSLPSNDGLGMKEVAIFLTEFDQLFSRFFIPMHFLPKREYACIHVEDHFQGGRGRENQHAQGIAAHR
jgi:hypothetical protein